jgi:hypothetical protein
MLTSTALELVTLVRPRVQPGQALLASPLEFLVTSPA